MEDEDELEEEPQSGEITQGRKKQKKTLKRVDVITEVGDGPALTSRKSIGCKKNRKKKHDNT